MPSSSWVAFSPDVSITAMAKECRNVCAVTLMHTAHLGDMMEAILATGSVAGKLLGEPSAELRAKMADSEARLFTPSSRCSHRSPAWARLLESWESNHCAHRNSDAS